MSEDLEGEVLVRPARPADAVELAALMNALDVHVGNPGNVYEAETILRDGFGPDPAFFVLLAERAGRVLGYLLWYPAYDTDHARRKMWVSDLYVRDEGRGTGAGAALMRAAAAEASSRNWVGLELPVHRFNQDAMAFYRRLGGALKDSDILRWDGHALELLAKS